MWGVLNPKSIFLPELSIICPTVGSPVSSVKDVSGTDPGVNGRCERIRTSDPFVPNEVRYQAALHTEFLRRANIPEALTGTNSTFFRCDGDFLQARKHLKC